MYVYVISDGSHVKIGIASDPQSRLVNLQVGNRLKLSLLHYKDCKCKRDATLLEQRLHQLYKKSHVTGEWFNVPPDEVIQERQNSPDYPEIERPAVSMSYVDFVRSLRRTMKRGS